LYVPGYSKIFFFQLSICKVLTLWKYIQSIIQSS
jgi:hypothetical protein